MTYLPDSVLVEKVAKALWAERHPYTPWVDPPFPSQEAARELVRSAARVALSVACPLVAGEIADRLDELFAETGASEAVDHITRLVRREFGEGA